MNELGLLPSQSGDNSNDSNPSPDTFSDKGGYYKFPNGLIMQWGKIDEITPNGDNGKQGPSKNKYNFPIPFPHSCLSISISDSLEKFPSRVLSNSGVGVYSYDRTGFIPFLDVYYTSPTEKMSKLGCHWIAIGY